MIDLIVFSVEKNKYAISIDNIIRIVQGTDLRSVPTSHEYIDGIMSYEDSIIKVLNFRKVINITTYEEELKKLFIELKKAHLSWIEALKDSLKNNEPFTKAINPHMCELGKWIDNFSCYDDEISVLLAELTEYHKKLHIRGGEVLEIYKENKKEAAEIFNTDMKSIYKHTIDALDAFVLKMDRVSNSMQKLLIYEGQEKVFAVKIDSIDDIAHVNESDIMQSDDDDSSEYLDVSGVLDLDGVLINVISQVRLPK